MSVSCTGAAVILYANKSRTGKAVLHLPDLTEFRVVPRELYSRPYGTGFLMRKKLLIEEEEENGLQQDTKPAAD